MKHIPLLALLLGFCLLQACATAPAPPAALRTPVALAVPQPITVYLPPLVPPAPPADERSPLDYYEWAKAAPAAELRAEQARLNSARTGEDPLVDAVHLGILMSVSAIASRDSEREAIALLEGIDPLGASAESHDYAVFADFLLSHLEQRQTLRAATSDVVASREQLETLERSNAQLQEKIEALTSIEEQLIEREQEQTQGDQ